MTPHKVKAFCKAVSKANRDGLVGTHQAKTIIGQAKSGQMQAAMRGLLTVMNKGEDICGRCQN